jgi:DNA mismatch endonuclease (patch repair protein)
MSRQCELLSLSRSSLYYRPVHVGGAAPGGGGESAENLLLMRLLDRQFLEPPFYGVRRMTAWLGRQGYPLFGSPDFTFPKLKLALFVDGCFWHSCPLHATLPASHRPFWRKKLRRNRHRDRLVSRTLRQNGWRVARLWEHDLKPPRLPPLAQKLRRLLHSPHSQS